MTMVKKWLVKLTFSFELEILDEEYNQYIYT